MKLDFIYSKYLLTLAIFLCVTGCATYNVHKGFSHHAKACTPYFKNGRSPTATFGGTMADVYYIYSAGAVLFKPDPPDASLTMFVISALDLPLSFLADLVLVPVSIPRDIVRVAKCSD